MSRISRIRDIKQEINRIQEQIDYLRTQQAKLKHILEELESSEYIDHCCVCENQEENLLRK